MELTARPLPPVIWAATPVAAQALIIAQRERIRDLDARLGHKSANTSGPLRQIRPSASMPESADLRPKARRPTGTPWRVPRVAAGRAGGCNCPRGTGAVSVLRAAVPPDQRPPPGPDWRQQVVELLPLAVRVTEYQMVERRCPNCGRRTRADLLPGALRRPFGPRLTAVVALLSGRYRLSRREVRQLLQHLWAVRLSLGAVVRQEQVQSAALAPVVE
jgi:transposase